MSFSFDRDYALLQSKCLPYVVSMLHGLYDTVAKYCRDEKEKVGWLLKGVKVITFVANEDHGLFDCFEKKELEKVLRNSVESYGGYIRLSGNWIYII